MVDDDMNVSSFWYHPERGSVWELPEGEDEMAGWTRKDAEKYFWQNLINGAVSWDAQKGARHFERGTKERRGGQFYYVDGWGDATWENPYPSDWRAVLDDDGREYFVNDATDEASWSVPEGEENLAWTQVHVDYDPLGDMDPDEAAEYVKNLERGL